MRAGTLVDATPIASASIRHGGEARWAGHRRNVPLELTVDRVVTWRAVVHQATGQASTSAVEAVSVLPARCLWPTGRTCPCSDRRRRGATAQRTLAG